jgi:hypothetical protein
VESFFPVEWAYCQVENDYGIDMRIEIVFGQEVIRLEFLVQLKPTDWLGPQRRHTPPLPRLYRLVLPSPPQACYVLVNGAQEGATYWLWIQLYLRQLDEVRQRWVGVPTRRTILSSSSLSQQHLG